MNLLVTGAKGFIGRNLVTELKNRGYASIMEYDTETDASLLDEYCQRADFVFHFAGVNRPEKTSEFIDGNLGFTTILLDTLKKHQNKCTILISSSIQAALDNPYGRSKKAAEELVRKYGQETGAKVLIYRFTNVFGKWCRPNYNSAIATFCHNISRGLPITVNDPKVILTLTYIDDLVEEMIQALHGNEHHDGDFCSVKTTYTATLERIVDLLYSFKKSREDFTVPDVSDDFVKKLYATYLSYLPVEEFKYPLKMNKDHRGSFTEFIKTMDRGQISVNISKPGIVKGNHWHHSKTEKFLVVSGRGVIRFRKIDSDEIIEYYVSDQQLEVIDIPTGYVHNIENLGDRDMVTIMWASECFNPDKPDTYFMGV